MSFLTIQISAPLRRCGAQLHVLENSPDMGARFPLKSTYGIPSTLIHITSVNTLCLLLSRTFLWAPIAFICAFTGDIKADPSHLHAFTCRRLRCSDVALDRSYPTLKSLLFMASLAVVRERTRAPNSDRLIVLWSCGGNTGSLSWPIATALFHVGRRRFFRDDSVS